MTKADERRMRRIKRLAARFDDLSKRANATEEQLIAAVSNCPHREGDPEPPSSPFYREGEGWLICRVCGTKYRD